MPKGLYYKLLICSLFLCFVGGGWFWWSSPSHLCIPVQIDDYWNVPLVQIKIGQKNYQVKLTFGADLSALDRKELREVDKQNCGIYTTLDTLGNSHERSMYEVFGVNIHGLKIPKMVIQETIPEIVVLGDPKKNSCCGHIGRRAFEGRNFLLDFAHSKMIISKNFEDLARDGYDLKNFIEVPFETNKAGFCFRVVTDLGEKVLALNPGLFHSFLRSSLKDESLLVEPFDTLQLWRSPKCTLGGYEFGPQGFVFLEISPLIDFVDGGLGMDFLKEHAVYIDAKKSVAYIERKPTN